MSQMALLAESRRQGSSNLFLPLLLAAALLTCLLMLHNAGGVASTTVGHLRVQETEEEQQQMLQRRTELEVTVDSASLSQARAALRTLGASLTDSRPAASGPTQRVAAVSALKRWEALTDLGLPLKAGASTPQGGGEKGVPQEAGSPEAAEATAGDSAAPGEGDARAMPADGGSGSMAGGIAEAGATGSRGEAAAGKFEIGSRPAATATLELGSSLAGAPAAAGSSSPQPSSNPLPVAAGAEGPKGASSISVRGFGGGFGGSSRAAPDGSTQSQLQHALGQGGGGPTDLQQRCPELTRELLQRHAKDNTVMLGVVNTAQQDFALNWLKLVQRAGISYAVLGAVDSNSSALLAKLGVPCFDFTEDAEKRLGLKPSQQFDWGAEGWRRMTWHKVFVLDKVADWGFNVVMSDMDVTWLRDPLPLFAKHPHGDLLFSTDGCSTVNEEGDDGLEKGATMYHNFNTGVYLFRNTSASAQWAHAWRALFDSGYADHDQLGAYQLTRTGEPVAHPKDPRITAAWNKSLYMGVIPPHVFMNGHTYMVQRLHTKMKVQPYAVHLTWTYNGIGGKRARLRDGMLLYDEPTYYSKPSFVTVELAVDKMPDGFNSWENEPMISFHLTSIQAQLYQAYIGMALATASGRAFISPEFQCFCEKIWYSVVHCRVVDAQSLQFPITCPTDYLFQPDHFQDDPAQFGTPLEFREHSFLNNPRTPASVKTSVLIIQPTSALNCEAKAITCTDEEIRNDGKTLLKVPANLDDTRLLALLRPYTKYRVWQLSFAGVQAPSEAFAGFSCLGAAKRFDARMEHLTTNWCCRNEEEAKHHNKSDEISVQLRMSRQLFSERPGLRQEC